MIVERLQTDPLLNCLSSVKRKHANKMQVKNAAMRNLENLNFSGTFFMMHPIYNDER